MCVLIFKIPPPFCCSFTEQPRNYVERSHSGFQIVVGRIGISRAGLVVEICAKGWVDGCSGDRGYRSVVEKISFISHVMLLQKALF